MFLLHSCQNKGAVSTIESDPSISSKGCNTNVMIDGTPLHAVVYLWRDYMPGTSSKKRGVRGVIELHNLTESQFATFRPEAFIVEHDSADWVVTSFAQSVEREGQIIRINMESSNLWEPDMEVTTYFRFFMNRPKPYCLKRKVHVQATY